MYLEQSVGREALAREDAFRIEPFENPVARLTIA